MVMQAHAHVATRRILLAVSGMSPQIITETLYGLAVARKPRWVPTEIQVVTTSVGAQLIRERVLDPGHGEFRALCKAYKLRGIAFDDSCVKIVNNRQGKPLADIATPADNEDMADSITALVRKLASDPSSQLHVSLAGGRKTMSYYAGYALSLFGRPHDQLSHVLVSPAEFESQPEFYFPSVESKLIRARDGKMLDCRDARVVLAEIPFVRLGDGLPKKLRLGELSFSATVRAAQKALDRPRADFDASRPDSLLLGGEPVRLKPRDLRFYVAMLRDRMDEKTVIKSRDGLRIAERMRKVEIALARDGFHGEDLAKKALRELGVEEFDQYMSRCNKQIEDGLGESAARAYSIRSKGPKSHTEYALFGIAPTDIQVTRGRASG